MLMTGAISSVITPNDKIKSNPFANKNIRSQNLWLVSNLFQCH